MLGTARNEANPPLLLIKPENFRACGAANQLSPESYVGFILDETMLSPKSQGTRNPYDYEQTSASAELFWLTVTVGTGVHGKLKKPTATGRLPSVVFGTRFARRRRKILKILCTILKRTYIILDVQIALKMKKKRWETVEKMCNFFRGA